MISRKKLGIIIQAARPNQWIKNLIIYTSLVFSGKLFDPVLFGKTFIGFVIFSVLSSTSYLLNDIIDYPFDQKHPTKRLRPIAAGELSVQDASFVVFLLSFIALLASLFFSIPFFGVAFVFLMLHFFYSLYFKFRPILDIFAISFSFMLRAFAGQVITGYHIQIWLLLTIFFISLFIASVKRHAELVSHGAEARKSLYSYKEHFLNFLTTTFATLTITTYSLYSFLEKPMFSKSAISDLFTPLVSSFEARKWFMITIPLVVFGISRYAHLLYEKAQGEAPERIITQDRPLIFTIILWTVLIVMFLYVF